MKWILPILCGVASLGFLAAGTIGKNYLGVYIALGIVFLIITLKSAGRVATIPHP